MQLFAAKTSTAKQDPIVETQPTVTEVAAPGKPVVQQPARTTVTVSTPARATTTTSTPARVAPAQPAARATTTTFAAVTPAGAPVRTASTEPTLVRASTTTLAPATATPAGRKQFTYTDPTGHVSSAEIVRGYQPTQIASPIAKIDPKIDPRLRHAATIAQDRARASTRRRCWRYVKEALLASGVIDSYPKTAYAKEAGDELVRSYGFKKLPIRDPYAAPVGSVLVYYKGRNRPGHVELRTKDGFVSDFRSKTPDRHALLGVFAKRG